MTTGTLNTTRISAAPRRSSRSSGSHDAAGRIARPARPRQGSSGTRTVPARRQRRTGRLGSQQRVSVRGRRVVPIERTNSSMVRWVVALTAMFVLGISAVMYLSGVTTEQSFQINDARQRSAELTNQLETLERDVAMAQSSSHIAEEASKLGMVAPSQAGILDVKGDKITERRASDPAATRPVIDVNGNVRPQGATSDPEETNNIPGLAPNSPAGAEAQANGGNAGLPYASRQEGRAPAPAPAAPAPAPAPTPAAPAPAAELPAPAPGPAPAPAPGQ